MPELSEIISDKRLVFLVGAPRSGTTWLQLMLARSKRIATVNETHLFAVYMRSLLEGNETFRGNPRAIGLSPLFSEAEYSDITRQFASAVLARILATKPDADVILEKTPSQRKAESPREGRRRCRRHPDPPSRSPLLRLAL